MVRGNMSTWITFAIGLFVTLATFLFSFIRQRNVYVERIDRANQEIVSTITKIIASLRDPLTAQDIEAVISAKCRKHGVVSDKALQAEQILEETLVLVIENEYIPKDEREKIKLEINNCNQEIESNKKEKTEEELEIQKVETRQEFRKEAFQSLAASLIVGSMFLTFVSSVELENIQLYGTFLIENAFIFVLLFIFLISVVATIIVVRIRLNSARRLF